MPEDLYEAPRAQISQGDILGPLPHVHLENPVRPLELLMEGVYRASDSLRVGRGAFSLLGEAKFERALLLTYDCELDKQNRRWLVCPIRTAEILGNNAREALKKNKIFSMLFLPRHRDILPDSFVDFNQISTLDPELVRQSKRELSLSDIGRVALYKQFIRWFARWTFQEITCPGCGIIFDPTLALPVSPPENETQA